MKQIISHKLIHKILSLQQYFFALNPMLLKKLILSRQRVGGEGDDTLLRKKKYFESLYLLDLTNEQLQPKSEGRAVYSRHSAESQRNNNSSEKLAARC